VKAVLVVAVIALVIYLVIRLVERLAERRRGPRPPGGGRPAPRVSGPDDDPDFLRDLDRRRKRPEKDDNT
jgi:hypothetical protein